MKKVYLCSPYSDFNFSVKIARFKEVCQIAADLMQSDKNLTIFSPIAHSHPIAVHGGLSGSADYWEKHNRSWIEWSDEIWIADMIGSWGSVGINEKEIPYAEKTGKKVVWL